MDCFYVNFSTLQSCPPLWGWCAKRYSLFWEATLCVYPLCVNSQCIVSVCPKHRIGISSLQNFKIKQKAGVGYRRVQIWELLSHFIIWGCALHKGCSRQVPTLPCYFYNGPRDCQSLACVCVCVLGGGQGHQACIKNIPSSNTSRAFVGKTLE